MTRLRFHSVVSFSAIWFVLAGIARADDGVEYRRKATDPVPVKKSDADGVEFRRGDLVDSHSSVPEDAEHSRLPAHPDPPPLPFVSTGETRPALKPLDDMFERLVTTEEVAGCAVAIAKDGQVVYARGFGYADLGRRIPVQPDSLFRIASLSKCLTSAGVLKLVDEGRLDLNQAVFPLLDLQPFLGPGGAVDPRLSQITVLQCLHHTAGWDRDSSFDAVFRPKWVADQMHIASPPGSVNLIRFQMGQPLQFDPGQRYRYSNFGYIVLGRVIEKVSGLSYEEFMRREVFTPLGMDSLRIGGDLREDRADGEVTYYTPRPFRAEGAIPPRVGQKVLTQYGVWSLRDMDAAGGWVGTALDLVKFAASFDDRDRPLLSPESVETTFGPPDAPVARRFDGSVSRSYYGCGWQVRHFRDGFNASHTGVFKPGSGTLMARRRGGFCWVVLCNEDQTRGGILTPAWVEARLFRAIDRITDWPIDEPLRAERPRSDLRVPAGSN